MNNKPTKSQSFPVSDLLPGYGFYDKMGGSLAENLVDLFELLSSLVGRMRKFLN